LLETIATTTNSTDTQLQRKHKAILAAKRTALKKHQAVLNSKPEIKVHKIFKTNSSKLNLRKGRPKVRKALSSQNHNKRRTFDWFTRRSIRRASSSSAKANVIIYLQHFMLTGKVITTGL
jgi:hypothetical protein